MRKLFAAAFLAICAMSRGAFAQEGSAYNVDDLSREGFVPAPVGEAEAINGGNLLLAAYVALWALMGLYLLRLVMRQRSVAKELGGLATQIRDVDDRLAELEQRQGRKSS
jgi:CcmD family protein